MCHCFHVGFHVRSIVVTKSSAVWAFWGCRVICCRVIHGLAWHLTILLESCSDSLIVWWSQDSGMCCCILLVTTIHQKMNPLPRHTWYDPMISVEAHAFCTLENVTEWLRWKDPLEDTWSNHPCIYRHWYCLQARVSEEWYKLPPTCPCFLPYASLAACLSPF